MSALDEKAALANDVWDANVCPRTILPRLHLFLQHQSFDSIASGVETVFGRNHVLYYQSTAECVRISDTKVSFLSVS